MTKTEALLRRMNSRPKSTILIGGRSEDDFVKEFFPTGTDLLVVPDLISEAVSRVSEFSILSPKNNYRLVVVKNLGNARRDNQSTLLKMIEESPAYTYWVLSTDNLDRVLKPILSRSFILDWVLQKNECLRFQKEIQEVLADRNYLSVFKLHDRLSKKSDGDMEVLKNLHLGCLSELARQVPLTDSVRVMKAVNSMKLQNRTELLFKSTLVEVLL